MGGIEFPRWRGRGPRKAAVAAGALVAGAMLAGGGVGTTARAYNAVGDTATATAACTTASKGHECAVAATFTDPNGSGIAGLNVEWTVTGCGSVTPATTVTGANGTTSTAFTTVTTCCGTTTITVAAPSMGVSGSTQVPVTCAATVGNHLPPTGGSPSGGDGGPPAWVLGLLLTGSALFVGGSTFLWVTRRRVAAQ